LAAIWRLRAAASRMAPTGSTAPHQHGGKIGKLQCFRQHLRTGVGALEFKVDGGRSRSSSCIWQVLSPGRDCFGRNTDRPAVSLRLHCRILQSFQDSSSEFSALQGFDTTETGGNLGCVSLMIFLTISSAESACRFFSQTLKSSTYRDPP